MTAPRDATRDELVKRLGELAWTLDAQGRKQDSVTCSKAALALSETREKIIEECAAECDTAAAESGEVLRRQPWSEYAQACKTEAESLAIRIRTLKGAAPQTNCATRSAEGQGTRGPEAAVAAPLVAPVVAASPVSASEWTDEQATLLLAALNVMEEWDGGLDEQDGKEYENACKDWNDCLAALREWKRLHDSMPSARPSLADNRCDEYCEADLERKPHCTVCPFRSVSIVVGGSTHVRTAEDWQRLARQDILATRYAPSPLARTDADDATVVALRIIADGGAPYSRLPLEVLETCRNAADIIDRRTQRCIRYERAPALDRRIAHGDDYAGDAWVRWTVPGHVPEDADPKFIAPALAEKGKT